MAPAPEAKTLATLPELAIAALGLAEFINADFTSFALRSGLFCKTTAAAPATCGLDMDVPDNAT